MVDKVAGGLSEVAGCVLRKFESLFTVGVRLPLDAGDRVVAFKFGGWLADLAGHKELLYL